MKKKGDLATPIIMWISVLAVIIIVASWYVTTLEPFHAESSVIEYDLRQLFLYLDNACISKYYEVKYNPRMNYGEIEFNESLACIKTKKFSSCIDLTCNVTDYFTANLTEIIDIIIIKNDTNLSITAEEYII